jgi:hypothetical protein
VRIRHRAFNVIDMHAIRCASLKSVDVSRASTARIEIVGYTRQLTTHHPQHSRTCVRATTMLSSRRSASALTRPLLQLCVRRSSSSSSSSAAIALLVVAGARAGIDNCMSAKHLPSCTRANLSALATHTSLTHTCTRLSIAVLSMAVRAVIDKRSSSDSATSARAKYAACAGDRRLTIASKTPSP